MEKARLDKQSSRAKFCKGTSEKSSPLNDGHRKRSALGLKDGTLIAKSQLFFCLISTLKFGNPPLHINLTMQNYYKF